MCTFDLTIKDEIAVQARSLFSDNQKMKQWLQNSLEQIITQAFAQKNNQERTEKHTKYRTSAFIDSLSLKGEREVPADMNTVESSLYGRNL